MMMDIRQVFIWVMSKGLLSKKQLTLTRLAISFVILDARIKQTLTTALKTSAILGKHSEE